MQISNNQPAVFPKPIWIINVEIWIIVCLLFSSEQSHSEWWWMKMENIFARDAIDFDTNAEFLEFFVFRSLWSLQIFWMRAEMQIIFGCVILWSHIVSNGFSHQIVVNRKFYCLIGLRHFLWNFLEHLHSYKPQQPYVINQFTANFPTRYSLRRF